ncbi:hypothetical protein Lal_00036710, partial [Lupinus albus]
LVSIFAIGRPRWDFQLGISVNHFLSIFASSNSDFRYKAFSFLFSEGENYELNEIRHEAQREICDIAEKELRKRYKQRDELHNEIRHENEERKRLRIEGNL